MGGEEPQAHNREHPPRNLYVLLLEFVLFAVRNLFWFGLSVFFVPLQNATACTKKYGRPALESCWPDRNVAGQPLFLGITLLQQIWNRVKAECFQEMFIIFALPYHEDDQGMIKFGSQIINCRKFVAWWS